jgi:hypothetical protein
MLLDYSDRISVPEHVEGRTERKNPKQLLQNAPSLPPQPVPIFHREGTIREATCLPTANDDDRTVVAGNYKATDKHLFTIISKKKYLSGNQTKKIYYICLLVDT